MCSVSSCDHDTPIHQLMCPGHWFMVPAALKTEVNDAYRAYRRTVPRTSTGTKMGQKAFDRVAWHEASNKLEAAQNAATVHVEAKLAERAARRSSA